ncbi:MAG TPA: hypothetical protein VJZ50_01470 [Candidatus Limnocylindrales bacterium]|nr:hypothetical protein [Candidatus Limnocylindrales bacterium]
MADAGGWIEAMLTDVTSAAASGGRSDGSVIAFSATLGRRIRADSSWPDAAISTYVRAREAIEAGQWDRATGYVDFFVDEGAVIFGFFRGLIPDAITYLEARGVSRGELAELNRAILAMLDLPDGRPFVARRRWAEFQDEVRRCLVACGAKDRDGALAHLAQLKEIWRQVQDRDVDHLYGLLNEAVRRWGEPVVGEFWDAIIGPLFQSRYEKFDTRHKPWEDSLWTNVYLAFEAMRGHLVGPDRDGSMEFSEDETRYTWRFDPCGSGGRSMRGDAIEGSPPRMESPFEYGVTEGEHDFAWNKKGVCYYCVNCCVVMQLMPIDRFGYPVRVVEPPTYPDRRDVKCTWHVYKDPADVPERYYSDVGRTKPDGVEGGPDPAAYGPDPTA